MSRRYRSEPIEVVVDRDGAPARFRWRGRRYVVRVVIASWVEAVPWWDTRVSGEPRAAGASGQRQVWRVEARVEARVETWVEAAGRTGAVGVYDLHRVPRGHRGEWGLARVLD